MNEHEPPEARAAAWKGALRLLAAAGRAEVRKLDKASKLGLIIDSQQHAVLSWLVDRLMVLGAVGEGEEATQQLLNLAQEQAHAPVKGRR